MAKFTGLLGELSGKLGGNVFARNKGGAYVRAFRSPINPRTSQQLIARSLYSGSVLSWHAQGDSLKADWNSFAANFFKPKYPTAGATYSGFNAYVSCRNQLENALASKSGSVSITGATFTADDILPSSIVPPRAGMTAGIGIDGLGPGGGLATANIIDVSGSYSISSRLISANLKLDTGYTVANFPVFEDPVSGLKTGLLIMGSLPLTQSQQFVKGPKYTLLAATELIGDVTPSAPSDTLTFAITAPVKSRKFDYVAGEIFEMNFFLFNSLGQTAFIGAAKVTAT